MGKKLNIAIAGGGTGGHVFPALNIAHALEQKRDCTFLFFGTQRGIEWEKIPAAGYPIVFIPVAGFQRRLTTDNLLFFYKLWYSLRIAGRELKQFNPDMVIGTGGYVMGPVLRKAVKMGIPTVIQEQNSYPGVTTRLLAAKVDRLFLGYEEAKEYLPKRAKILVTGNPITANPVKRDHAEICTGFGLDPQLKTILVFGGSQGALHINEAVSEMIAGDLIPASHQLLWQTGQNMYEKYRGEHEKAAGKVVTVPFIERMSEAYAIAEFCICRAGAMTLSEISAAGLPAVTVPLKHAAGGHQLKNARSLAEKGAALVVEDDADLKANLQRAVFNLINNEKELRAMSEKMLRLARPDALINIVNEIEKIIYPECRDKN